jgi:isoprenylcysteine carboxyl methyltransferase (ICMT) family protein YpbQ
MSSYLIAFVVLAFAWRLLSVAISARHEKALKAAGGVEHGASNSLLLAAFHVLYYIAALAECFSGAHVPNLAISIIGIIIYLAAALVLVSVMTLLGELWTIKIIIGHQHRLVKKGLFSFVRHPNYFLNIIPELVGFALALNAYWTLIVGIPLYLIPLITRIRQEEKVMRAAFPAYG